jgi:hypothetical protein
MVKYLCSFGFFNDKFGNNNYSWKFVKHLYGVLACNKKCEEWMQGMVAHFWNHINKFYKVFWVSMFVVNNLILNKLNDDSF